MSLIKSIYTAALLALSPITVSAEEKPIDFVTIGDSGYEGAWYSFFGSWYIVRAQSWAPSESGLPVMAPMLQRYCKANPCQFALMLGDNIYPDGVDGVDPKDDQKRFNNVFIKPFTPLLEDNPTFRIFPTLGNHDWRGKRKGAFAQVEFLKNTPPFDMRGLFYSVKPEGAEGKVEVFVIDTEMLLSTLTVYEDHLNDDGSENRDLTDLEEPDEHLKPVTDGEKNQIEWLEAALKSSTAEWKIVIGHHPLWSSGSTKFEQSHALRAAILPTLCRHADAYMAGHEHTMEVHADTCETAVPKEEAKPLLHIVSGAFSKSRLINPGFKAYQDRTYPQLQSQYAKGKIPAGETHQYKQLFGFAHISLQGDTAMVRIMSHTEDTPAANIVTPSFQCSFTKDIGFGEGGCAAQLK